MGLLPLGPMNVKGRGRGGVFSKFCNKGCIVKAKAENNEKRIKTKAKANTATTVVRTNRGWDVKDGMGARDFCINQHAAPKLPTESCKKRIKTKAKVNTAIAAMGMNKGRKVKDRMGARDFHIDQHAAPKLPRESRDDIQPLVKQQKVTTDEITSPGRSDNSKQETKISKDSLIKTKVMKAYKISNDSSIKTKIIKDSSIAAEAKRNLVKIIYDFSNDKRTAGCN
jgi:hypothetical protein